MSENFSMETVLFIIFITVIASVAVGYLIKRKSALDVEKVWRTQDWIWLISFMLYAQVFTILYKEMVMDVVSYVSTFVSTALGAVAIYISVREATKGDKVKDEMNVMLGELREKLSQMDNKINRFDPEYNSVRDNKIEEVIENLKKEIKQELVDTERLSNEQIIAVIDQNVKQAKEDLKTSLDFVDFDIIKKNNLSIREDIKTQIKECRIIVKDIVGSMKEEGKTKAESIQALIRNKYNRKFYLDVIISCLNEFCNDGILEYYDGYYIKRIT